MNLPSVWRQIENKTKCKGGRLEHPEYKPLVIEVPKPEIVKIIVMTEGPNRKADEGFLTSIANHPTYTFLYALFGGRSKPVGSSANAYWTHVRKCFINGETKKGRTAIETCSKAYLETEIGALEPKLIVSVGNEALYFLSKYDERLHGKLTYVFSKQTEGIFKNAKISEISSDITIVPHPSGLNRFWNDPPKTALRILGDIRKLIMKALG